MNTTGVPVGGLKTVGQIVATNTLTFQAGRMGWRLRWSCCRLILRELLW